MKSNIIKTMFIAVFIAMMPIAAAAFAEKSSVSSLPSVLQQKVTNEQMRLSRIPKGTTDKDLAEIYGKIGMLYQAGNLADIAIANYAHAYELNNKEPKWMYLLAYLLSQQGRSEEAYVLYRTAYDLNDGYMPILLRIAQLSLEKQDYAEAKNLFQKLSEIPQYGATSAEGLGQVALKTGEYDKAIEHFNQALKIQPDANRNYYFLAQSYKKKGDKDLAKQFLTKRGEVIAGFPDPLLDYVKKLYATGQQFLEKGIQQIKSGNYQQSLKLFDQGITIDPENLTLKTALGRAYEYQGDTKQAEKIYTQVLAIDNENNIALFNMGALNDALGKTKIARNFYLETLKVQDDNLDALSLLASMEFRLGNFAIAEQHFTRMLVLNPNLYDARVYLGMTYLAMDQCQTGSKVLWGALKLKPSDGNVALVLAVAEAQCKKNPQSWGLVEQVYQESPGLKSARLAALVAGFLNKYQDALELQRHAMFEALKQGGLSRYPDLQVNLQNYSTGKKPVWSWKTYSREISPLPPIRTAE